MIMANDLTVCIVTFARPIEIRRSIYAFLKYCDYPREHLKFHLADNDTESRFGITDYIPNILSDFKYLTWDYTLEKRQGWGYNVNTALKHIQTDYVFLMEDDYMCLSKLRLLDGTQLMDNQETIGIIRYDGTAAHSGLCYTQLEFVATDNRFDYLVINKAQSRHLNVYSNRPHLRHKHRIERDYGLYIEGAKLGQTEENFAHKIKSGMGKSDVVILDDGIQLKFEHIGASFQNGVHDK